MKTPLTPAVQLHTATDEDHAAFQNLNINYRSFTGVLNYLACRTRPDLAAAVSILSQFNQKPGLSHWQEVLHCWKYLKGTSTLGLLLKPCPEKKKKSNQLLYRCHLGGGSRNKNFKEWFSCILEILSTDVEQQEAKEYYHVIDRV